MTVGRARPPEKLELDLDLEDDFERAVQDTDGQRPTVRPPFDPEGFARDSDAKLRAASTPSKQDTSGVRSTKVRLSGHPTNVLMIDGDLAGRADIGRGLLRAQCRLTAVATVDELDEALASDHRFDVVLVNVDRPVAPHLATLVAVEPDLPVVALSRNLEAAIEMVTSAGVQGFALCKRDASIDALVKVLRAQVARPVA
jgi:hypothetical protein